MGQGPVGSVPGPWAGDTLGCLTRLQGGQGEGLTGPQIWRHATRGRRPVSFLELHLHLGTAWSCFRPQAEWGAGWGRWRLLLLAGCSAVRREGEQGRGHHGVWGVDRGTSRAPCSEADRSACRLVVTAPCRGEGGGAAKRLLLGGLEKARSATLSPPTCPPPLSLPCAAPLCCAVCWLPRSPTCRGRGV